MASQQQGGSRLGAIALAIGTVPQLFQALSPSPVSYLHVNIGVTGKASGASSFPVVVDTGVSAAAEGTDDLDILLNSIWDRWSLFVDPQTFQGVLSPQQWRTIFGLMNFRDFEGNFVNGASVPGSGASAKTFTIVFQIPYSLELMFRDGFVFHQGSARMKGGEIDVDSINLTPTVVLANGSLVVSSVTWQTFVIAGAGTEGDIGPTWSVKRTLNLDTTHTFSDKLRVLIADVNPPGVNTATNIDVGQYTKNWTPLQFQNRFQAEMIGAYGGAYDISQRCTPYDWIPKGSLFSDLAGKAGREMRLDITGETSLGVYDLTVSTDTLPDASSDVSAKLGASGPTTHLTVAPPSVPAGTKLPNSIADMAPVRVFAGTVPGAPATAVRANPTAASAGSVVKGNRAAQGRLRLKSK